MGKHEVVKPATSTERVRRHREAMRAKGYKLKQRWVIDKDDPAVRARLRIEAKLIDELDRHSGDAEWADAFFESAWADLPD